MPDIILKDQGLQISWVNRLGLSRYLSEFVYISTWINNTDIWKCNMEAKDIHVDDIFRIVDGEPADLMGYPQSSVRNPDTR